MAPRLSVRPIRSFHLVLLALAVLRLGSGAVATGTEPTRTSLEFLQPRSAIQLQGRDARLQLLVTENADGFEKDVTRDVDFEIDATRVAVDDNGYLRPIRDGETTITAVHANGQSTKLSIEIAGTQETQSVNFPNQIVPIFTKFGCNGGGCHGKLAGQAGFKLSLLGFEPKEDFDHLVNESRGRRVFPAAAEKSLLLRKATNDSPHGGGERLGSNTPEYRLLKRWIETGMPYGNATDPVVTGIEIFPAERRLPRRSSQQLSVLANYSDGHWEDITHTAQYESNNVDLADVSDHGLVDLANQSGDVSIMARYQGHVAVFRASVPLGVDLTTTANHHPDHWPSETNVIDELVFSKLKSLGIPPSDLCSDASFVRRVTLDLAGRLPTPEETISFTEDSDNNKTLALVNRLLESKDHAEFFARKWTTILRNRRSTPAHQFQTFAFHDWLQSNFYENKPYDQIVRELLTASGTVENSPPVAWYREVKDAESRTEDAAQLFLGQRLQCARCHHHPFEKWSQKDYFQMVAFFSKVAKKEGEQPEDPVFFSRMGGAGARHPKSGEFLKPAGLDGQALQLANDQDPREHLVDWMVDGENPFFARSLVNRYWKHFFAMGMVEPEDDMRVTNPPSNPELLDELANRFSKSGYDIRQLLRLICTSTTYRLDSASNEYNLRDNNSFSRYYPKRLQAEVLLDAINSVTLSTTKFNGLPEDTRAVSLPDTSYTSYFMNVFGQPDSATACECERTGEATLAQSLHLLNSKEVQQKLTNDAGMAATLANNSASHVDNVSQLYLVALSRKPSADELAVAKAHLDESLPDNGTESSTEQGKNETRKKLRSAYEDLIWAIINTKEFLFNH